MVASLWKVDDQATRSEMVAFYKAIQEGKNMAEAMQAAATSLIASPETAHPFYWAAFTVIGDWR
jgi:CHAT domain-containing protein